MLPDRDGIPGSRAEIAMPCTVPRQLQHPGSNIGLREVSHRIAVWLEEENDVLAVSDPSSSEAHAHTSTQGFGV
jgi:hypothetical protein